MAPDSGAWNACVIPGRWIFNRGKDTSFVAIFQVIGAPVSSDDAEDGQRPGICPCYGWRTPNRLSFTSTHSQ
jgi:hypothetical protein